MACIASVLLSSSLKMGALDPRMILLSLRNRDLATVYLYFIKLNTWHVEHLEWQREMLKIGLCCRNSFPPLRCEGVDLSWAGAHPVFKRDKRRVCRSFVVLLWCDRLQSRYAEPRARFRLPNTTPPAKDCPDATELGELEARVHTDGVA